jgi:hypothetical protein
VSTGVWQVLVPEMIPGDVAANERREDYAEIESF